MRKREISADAIGTPCCNVPTRWVLSKMGAELGRSIPTWPSMSASSSSERRASLKPPVSCLKQVNRAHDGEEAVQDRQGRC